MHWSDGSWWWWIPMTLTMVAFWALVIWAVVRLAGAPWSRQGRSGDEPDPARILDERLARGEIGASEYRELRDELTRHRRPG